MGYTSFMTGGKQFIESTAVFDQLGIKEGYQVADFGCGGSGHFTFPLANLVGENGTVYAVDILKSVLSGIESESKRRGATNVKTVWSDLERYEAAKIESESLDMGFVVNVLYQSKNHPAVIKECYRMIVPGGKLVIIDWKQTAAPFGPPVDARIGKENIIELCEVNDLRLVSEFDAGKYHQALVFEK